jgi:hypothetical protein
VQRLGIGLLRAGRNGESENGRRAVMNTPHPQSPSKGRIAFSTPRRLNIARFYGWVSTKAIAFFYEIAIASPGATVGAPGRHHTKTLLTSACTQGRIDRSAVGGRNMSETDVIANQKLILENQNSIIANQGEIKANQGTIQSNQAEILKNQKSLDTIIANQEQILALLRK